MFKNLVIKCVYGLVKLLVRFTNKRLYRLVINLIFNTMKKPFFIVYKSSVNGYKTSISGECTKEEFINLVNDLEVIFFVFGEKSQIEKND